jgi:hypothetical protein
MINKLDAKNVERHPSPTGHLVESHEPRRSDCRINCTITSASTTETVKFKSIFLFLTTHLTALLTRTIHIAKGMQIRKIYQLHAHVSSHPSIQNSQPYTRTHNPKGSAHISCTCTPKTKQKHAKSHAPMQSQTSNHHNDSTTRTICITKVLMRSCKRERFSHLIGRGYPHSFHIQIGHQDGDQ